MFDCRGDDGKKQNLNMILPENYDIEENLTKFIKKDKTKISFV